MNRIRIYYSGLETFHEFDTTMTAEEVARLFEIRVGFGRRISNWLKGIDPSMEFARVYGGGSENDGGQRTREVLEVFSRVREVRSVVRVAMPMAQRKTT